MYVQEMTMQSRNAAALRRRRRARMELADTIKEAAVTMGIGLSFFACSILLLCAI